MEMFHVLRPGERVKGVIKESHPISCSVTLPLDEERRKLKDILSEIYKVGNSEFNAYHTAIKFCVFFFVLSHSTPLSLSLSLSLVLHMCSSAAELNDWASEASPTLGCSIDIS